MFIAKQLKKTNICEYMLYMWQIEDIIRAFEMDIDKINMHIIEKHQLESEAEKKMLYEWYESIIDMMRAEGKTEHGHIQLNTNTLQEITEFHNLLINSAKQPDYNAKFIHILPFINQLRSKSDTQTSDIELCFNFQYGILILRIKKADIRPETLTAQNEVSKFMVLLNKYFILFKEGTLDLEE